MIPEFIREKWDEKWDAMGRPALIAWLVFYGLFLLYLFHAAGEATLFDNVNLVVHEGGHALFGWFGMTIGIMGGTILQLLVPLLLCIGFFWKRQLAGTAFCAFVFFENFLPIATYMADARAMQLDLVTIGDPENAIHDFHYIFAKFGLLEHDTQIGAITRFVGWIGMFAVIAWLAYRATRPQPKTFGATAR